MAVLKGVLLTLKAMGVKWVVKEAVRRTLKIPYTYKGIPVRDVATFRLLRAASMLGSVWGEGDQVFFRNKLGTFAVSLDDAKLFYVFAEDLEGMYGYLDVAGKVVADVGACLGETSVMFAKMGARWVHAYEPVYYRYVEHNLRLNGVANATVHPYGVWIEEGTLSIAPQGFASGLALGDFKIATKPVEDVITDVVKMDCEGCEWSLLTLPCSVIRRAEEYAIEIHGPEPPLVKKLEKCGYRSKQITKSHDMLTVWYFKRYPL